jgi:Conserved nitrate reductase-associated protein (Nitr_red_assoc)
MTLRRFRFEPEDLELLPLDLRRKLDLAGKKLSLAAWQHLSEERRAELCDAAVETLAALDAPGIPPRSPWREPGSFEAVVAAAGALGVAFDRGAWDGFDDSERHALWHLAEPRRRDRLAALLRELLP